MQSQKIRARMRTGLAAVGVAALLVGGLNIASDAAGNAKPVLLGKSNKAKKTTKISNKKAGPVLALKAKSGPALSVNTTDLIANLNADQLDGKSAEVLSPTPQTFSIGAYGTAGTGASQIFQTTTLPAGTYEFFMGGTISAGTGDSNACGVLDLTKLLANPADFTAIYLDDEVSDGAFAEMSGHRIGDVVAGHRIAFICNVDTTSDYITPVQFTIRKLDSVAPIPGVAPGTFPKAAGGQVGALR